MSPILHVTNLFIVKSIGIISVRCDPSNFIAYLCYDHMHNEYIDARIYIDGEKSLSTIARSKILIRSL